MAMNRSCEVCGVPAVWASGLPETAHLANRQQRYLCAEHRDAWFSFVEPDDLMPGNRVNHEKFQKAFDRFVESFR